MSQLWIQTESVDATRDIRIDSSKPEPTNFEDDEVGVLYRALRNNLGRCIGKVYTDTQKKEVVPIGWVFQKRQEYDRSNRTRKCSCGPLRIVTQVSSKYDLPSQSFRMFIE